MLVPRVMETVGCIHTDSFHNTTIQVFYRVRTERMSDYKRLVAIAKEARMDHSSDNE